MTAVASPPSLQHLGSWNSGDGREGPDTMSAEEVTRMFMPRKSPQRTNSASSVATSSSTSSSSPSTVPTPEPPTNSDTPITNGEQGGWGGRKKATRGLWPSSKAEPVSGLTTARPQALATPSSGQSAASTMNIIHQPSPVLPPQNRIPAQLLQNGVKGEHATSSADSPAVLALVPMTGTFERKRITLPFFPEVMRIGRQTNVKTVPTATNGYFDSKVLSRQHAEVWADRNGKIWIRDVKSSNGTFVNGARLSPENRDSEPHELREQDTLELGIDIVSEDQKSIVHHKVSAKVELAGIYTTQPSLMDLDLNANTTSNVAPGEQISQMRGRGGSQGSVGSNGRISGPSSMAGGNPNLMGAQRHASIWMGAITIEQVVKRLTTEVKQAKHQSHSLHNTEDFFGTLKSLKPGEEPPKSPPKPLCEAKPANDVPPPNQPDFMSPFSQPPAPPPQQPLPEKPDMARYVLSEALSSPSLRRTETEKPRSALSSPTRSDPPNGQIVSLLEALKSAKQEIDSQGDRMKYLEDALAQERKAREDAERRARNLSNGHLSQKLHGVNGADEEIIQEPDKASLEDTENELLNGHISEGEDEDIISQSISSVPTIKHVEDMQRDTEDTDASTSRLQARLDLMVQEMDEMKTVMESYKQRAESAEEGRRSLADMVGKIRAGRESHSSTLNTKTKMDEPNLPDSSEASSETQTRNSIPSSSPDAVLSPLQQNHDQTNGTAVIKEMHREFEKTVSSVLQQQQQWGGPAEGGRMVQSTPYVSMLGVVLIGVGIMTWLNGWQPGGGER